MALQPNALLTVAEMRGPLGISGTDQDAMIEELINRASDAIEADCGRAFTAMPLTNLRLEGQRGSNLRPPRVPIDVAAAITITLDAVALTVWKTEADGDPAAKDVEVAADAPGVPSYFYRRGGWLGATRAPILLSYTGGYATIPGGVKEACTLTVQAFARHAKNLEPYQSYPASVGGGTVTMRTDTIPHTARMLLDPFRWWVVA